MLLAVALCDFRVLSLAYGQVTAEKPLNSISERQPIDYQPVHPDLWTKPKREPKLVPRERE